MSGITSITFLPDLGSTPARVNRLTGEMEVSKAHWAKMTPEQRAFVLLHEHAHAVTGTRNEFEADALAFKLYADNGLSLKKSVSALTEVLPFTSKEHLQRAVAQYQRARLYDYQVNGNQAAKTDLLKKTKMNDIFQTSFSGERPDDAPDVDLFLDFDGDETDSFLGLGKKGRARREERKDKKNARKIERKTAIIAARGEARKTAGGGFGNQLATALGSIGGKLLGKNAPAEEAITPDSPQVSPAGSGNKNMIYIGVAIAVVVVLIIIFRKK